MTRLLPVLLVLALQAPSTQQIRDTLETISQQLHDLIALMPETPPIASSADLQKALDAGGTVTLPKGLTFAGDFKIAKSGTTLVGNGSTLSGNGPALAVKPGVADVEVSDVIAVSSGPGAVIQCGDNGSTQTTIAQQPTRVTFRNVTIPTHRGKRGFEINCSATIIDSSVSDTWSTALADSQAIAVLNSCGPVTVTGGTFVAGSENVMVGGDLLKITDCPGGVASQLLFDRVTLTKPEEWRTDGVKRQVKNLFELKAGTAVILRDSTLSGSWGTVQDGSAIVITPKNGQYIRDVLIDNVTVTRASGGLQLMGKDYNSVTPNATTGIIVRNSRFTLSKTYAGRGILALVTGGMLEATFDNVSATFDGNAIVICDTQTPVGPLTFLDSRMTTGPYGVMAPGVNYAGPAPAGYELRACVTSFKNNTLADAPSRFKTNQPENTWVTRAELDAILAR